MIPYKVLGTYIPTSNRCWRIGRDLTRLTKQLGFIPLNAPDDRYERAPWNDPRLHAHVRRRTLRSEAGSQWHQDGDFGHIPMNHGLVFWSNRTPTEFRIGDQVYQPDSYDVVYINNLDCYHRRPPNAPRHRFIFRQRVECT